MPKKSLKNWWDLLNHNTFAFRKNQTPYFHPFFAYSEQLSPNSIIALLESPPQAVIAKPLCMMGRTPQTHHHSHKSMDNPFMKIGCPEGGERGGGLVAPSAPPATVPAMPGQGRDPPVPALPAHCKRGSRGAATPPPGEAIRQIRVSSCSSSFSESLSRTVSRLGNGVALHDPHPKTNAGSAHLGEPGLTTVGFTTQNLNAGSTHLGKAAGAHDRHH